MSTLRKFVLAQPIELHRDERPSRDHITRRLALIDAALVLSFNETFFSYMLLSPRLFILPKLPEMYPGRQPKPTPISLSCLSFHIADLSGL